MCCSHTVCPSLFLHLSYERVLVIQDTSNRWASWRPFPYMKKGHKFWKNPSTHCADGQILPTTTTVSPESRTELGALSHFGEGTRTYVCPTPYQDPYQAVSHPLPRLSRPFDNLFPAHLCILSSQYPTLSSSSSLHTLHHTTCWLSHAGYATSCFFCLKDV